MGKTRRDMIDRPMLVNTNMRLSPGTLLFFTLLGKGNTTEGVRVAMRHLCQLVPKTYHQKNWPAARQDALVDAIDKFMAECALLPGSPKFTHAGSEAPAQPTVAAGPLAEHRKATPSGEPDPGF